MLEGLRSCSSDPLLGLIGLYARDPRPDKIDMGVGVYRDERGETPVFRAVKAAEARLVESQASKSYLAPGDDPRFVDLLRPLIFGTEPDGVIGVHTAGGTGALRLAASLMAQARPGGTVWLGTPTWPPHAPIFASAGLTLAAYNYFDQGSQSVRFDEMIDAFSRASLGDAVLLHGCCHNPTGADLSPEQWNALAEVIGRRGLLPVIDLAYQGLGAGLKSDAAGLRRILDAAEDVIVTYSCDKNFGLYRERVGALYVRSGRPSRTDLIRANVLALAPMAPDHGASVVRLILEDPALSADWQDELAGMQRRIADLRGALAAGDPGLAALAKQSGLFSLLPLTVDQIVALRRDHAIYMAESGRANLAGLSSAAIGVFLSAFAAVRR